MNNQQRTVAMSVNNMNLIQGLRHSFTNSTTVLTELMQNARRAGATFVDFNFDEESSTLTVTDNGRGVDDMASLLSVAESGWDEEIKQQEHCYGMGFLSALFACEEIQVTSKGKEFRAATEDILVFRPVTVLDAIDGSFTHVTLHGVKITRDVVADVVEKACTGFPIPVSVNGVQFNRPHALDEWLKYIDTRVGKIWLRPLMDVALDHFNGVGKFSVYLQGLPVYKTHGMPPRMGDRDVVHLDSRMFHARLPDRDKLVNEDEVIKEVKAVIREERIKQLEEYKAITPAKDFCRLYQLMDRLDALYLLNDVDVIPPYCLVKMVDYPNCDGDTWGRFMAPPSMPVSREELAQKGVVASSGLIQYDGAAELMFIREKDMFQYVGNLPEAHWIHGYINRIEGSQVEIIGEANRVMFREWVECEVVFCESYTITINGVTVEIDDEAMYTGSDGSDEVLMPKKCANADVLTQISSYQDDCEAFNQLAFDLDQESFTDFLIVNRTKDPAVAFKQLLPFYVNSPMVKGKRFLVTVDATGRLSEVKESISQPELTGEKDSDSWPCQHLLGGGGSAVHLDGGMCDHPECNPLNDDRAV